MIKTCKYCGKEFYAEHHQSKYCKECKAYSLDVLKGKVRDNRIPQICEHCGKEYIHNRKTMYCSHECAKMAQSERLKRERQENKETAYCKWCGKEFIPEHGAIYCSKRCQQKAKHKRQNRIKKPLSYTYTCKYCGKVFHPMSNERQYCCKSCSVKDRHKDKPPKSPKVKPVCVICGKEFEGPLNSKYCSKECQKEKAKRRAYETSKIKHEAKTRPRKCKECGRIFTPEYGAKKRMFCSEICCKRNTSRIAKATRRARQHGNAYEPINPIEIFQRDQWTCQLCGIKTPRKLRGTTNDRAPELDHIIPLAKGGEHTRKNVQCSCRKCNQAKGDTILGQLRLC